MKNEANTPTENQQQTPQANAGAGEQPSVTGSTIGEQVRGQMLAFMHGYSAGLARTVTPFGGWQHNETE